MNSRRLTLVLVRTAAFFVVGLIVFPVIGWSWFGAAAIALIAAAMAVQFGGVLWLRRAEKTTSPSPAATEEQAHRHDH
ncbi:hypothetical protein FHX42_001389 [Saccharopolyspora lacisalsi]|uniref:DUF4229 domain-containing protein n=1 Tax=Halosaccharopolyspora lacisalsi TaxID=1000566 RepID=A0A839DSY5_9PSEU|nr:hypothetical protein [Halosaccharopolyspora lacisalsi]MBA8824060.1 hypothetical protein [Halosaccharopolyspora lacisalsi]